MMDAQRILKVATALSDGHRITIFLEVARRGTIPYKEMAALTALSQPAFSHHIKILAESGLLKTRKTGRAVGLSLDEQLLKQVSAFFLQVLQSAA
ncbi:MAG: helix-turn-helix transcriptional regulator [Cytophagales bacterium]|nr:helix-turn-helix transcriptional regulator [Cytophagales bacterium]